LSASRKDNDVARQHFLSSAGQPNMLWCGGEMDKINWIKDLVLAEQQMEESGVIDVSGGFDPEKHLAEATFEFMRDLKAAFIESALCF
jgi:hypothetical protein